MASMLEALKRIEARAPRDCPAEQPCAAQMPEPTPDPPSDAAPPPCPTPESRLEEADRRGWDLADLLARPTPKRDRPYRDLAANILSQLEPDVPSAVLFASGSSASGKPPGALVKRLATVLARQVRGEVLAVDLDLRQPTLAEDFRIRAKRGLADVLLETAAWQDMVEPSGVAGLSVLPGGKPRAAGPATFGRVQPAGLIDELRQHYRLVLLDAGGLRPDELAPWTSLCEATYLVVKLGQTSSREARQAAKTLERAGGRVLGSVLGVPMD